MYWIFSNWGGYRNGFYTPTTLHQKIVLGGYKNNVTGIIHLLTSQSINNLLYFLNLGVGRVIEIFFISHPLHKNCFWGGGVQKNDVTEMIHLLTFQSIKNILYFFLILGGYRNISHTPTPYTKKT